MLQLKIKKLTTEQIIISVDRLTRFKAPEEKYTRVYKEIILSNLLEPKFKKSELEEMPYETLRDYAEKIINYSISSDTEDHTDNTINKKLLEYEKSIFHINKTTETLLNNKIDYQNIIKILPENIPENLKYLKSLNKENQKNTGFPIKRIILCEGITEETLLPEFAKLCGYDLKKHGVYIVSAGGKNQVVKYFYKYAEILKIPIFVLLDNDAQENLLQIKPKLRKSDKIHLIKSGEFEDLLPVSLIKKALNYTAENISDIQFEGLEDSDSKVSFLEDFYKHRGLHEFKKADFALAVKDNISDITDISEEIKEIINELKF